MANLSPKSPHLMVAVERGFADCGGLGVKIYKFQHMRLRGRFSAAEPAKIPNDVCWEITLEGLLLSIC